jgi:ABC-type multidrug transport system ATPase subunit
MLTLSHISKNYGKSCVLEDISLELGNGLYGILAPNGAGKTTLIKMITTLIFPSSGEILYDGVEIQKMGEKYRDMIGYLPQQFGYYKNNTPTQYLNYLAALKGMPRYEAVEKTGELLALVGLSDAANLKMNKFSGGMIQRIGIAQALLNNPKILILDEPTSGLDPKERARLRNIISTISMERIVIMSTHIVSDIESIANFVIILKDSNLYRMDSVANICSELEGKVYECNVFEDKYTEFEKEHFVLLARQEHGFMRVRYFTEEKTEKSTENGIMVTPNLEDVFLVIFREKFS